MATTKPNTKAVKAEIKTVKPKEVKPTKKTVDTLDKKEDKQKIQKGKKINMKIYFKTDDSICSMFVIVDKQIVLELHGNADSWKAVETKFGPFNDLQVKDVKEVEQYPDIAINFETSKIYRGHHE